MITAAQAFAVWLQHEEPALFAQLQAAAAAHAAAPSPPAVRARAPGLGDWSSVLSSIGSGIETVASDVGSGLSTAASDVGNYLSSSSGQQTLADVAKAYEAQQASAAQSQVLQLQMARAAAGQAPAAVSYTTNPATGQVVPVYTGATLTPQIATAVNQGLAIPTTTNNGQPGYTLTPALTASLAPSTNYMPWVIGGGLALLALLALRK